MVVDPDASLLSQLSDLTDITLVSVPSFRQPPEFTQNDFCGSGMGEFRIQELQKKINQ
jgi:hypothetical protein